MTQPPALFPTLRRQFEHWLFDLPEAVGGRAMRWVMLPLRYLYALLRDLGRGELGLRAMSLVYSTLFAIVPVIAVAFSVLKAFGYHRELEPVLFEFLRPLGDQGYELTKSIMGFVENVQGTILGTVGFAILLYTAVSMIQKTEESLNFVWHVERPRSLARRVSEYLVVMLVGPAMAVFAMVLLARIEASDALARLSGLATGDTGTFSNAHLTPYLMVVALFAFVYMYMPNTRVRLGPAGVGALFGGVLWAAVGALFARIVVYSAKTAAIYAGLAVVLLFLVWVYLSWLILLLGAQLSFYVQHPEHLRGGHAEVPLTSALRERVALAVMYLVGERFVAGGTRWTIAGLAERLDVPGTVLDTIVSALQEHGLVLDVEDDSVAPARDLSAITLDAILDAVRHETPDPRRPTPRAVPEADQVARLADEALRASLRGRTLRDLLAPRT
ncbi:MAG: YihY family inner membrane protein [Steroidobacteraceae bacterium]|nr:YihY family inner membrane protein [Steroidobacteraceae bacterium]